MPFGRGDSKYYDYQELRKSLGASSRRPEYIITFERTLADDSEKYQIVDRSGCRAREKKSSPRVDLTISEGSF